MKKQILILIFSCVSTVLFSQAEECKTVREQNYFPEKVSNIIFEETKLFPCNAQLSIALIKDHDVTFLGIKKIADTIKPIENEDNLFEIGSITKVLTSSVLASLVLEKKINLDDVINPYYPFTFKNDIPLVFKNLANHTSGLPRLPENLEPIDETNPYKHYKKEQIEYYLKNIIHLEHGDDLKFLYSNLGAGLLGYTLALSQKTNFSELLKDKVLNKYDMNNSFTSNKNLGNKLVKGINLKGEIISNWDFDVLVGAGGVLSTVKDLSKFVVAQFDTENKELKLTRTPTFTINEQLRIGLGWHILKSKDGKDIFWHNGGTGGYSSSIVVNVENKVGVIILSNVSSTNSVMEHIDMLCFRLLNEIEMNNTDKLR